MRPPPILADGREQNSSMTSPSKSSEAPVFRGQTRQKTSRSNKQIKDWRPACGGVYCRRFKSTQKAPLGVTVDFYHRKPQRSEQSTGRDCQFCAAFDPNFEN